MKKYLLISFLDYSIVEAETEQKAFVTHVTQDANLKNIGATKEEMRKDLIAKGFKTMKPTKIINCYVLS